MSALRRRRNFSFVVKVNNITYIFIDFPTLGLIHRHLLQFLSPIKYRSKAVKCEAGERGALMHENAFYSADFKFGSNRNFFLASSEHASLVQTRETPTNDINKVL